MTVEAAIIESMFRVVSKDGDDVDFKLNRAQRQLDDNLTGRDVIPKARQRGVSTYFLARQTVRCLSRRNVGAVIISHESEATQRLLSRCQYFLENLRGRKAQVGRESLNTITFPKMNSRIYIGTAGSRKFGRGDTITNLHCSEIAYWPDPKTTMGGLLEAVPASGEVGVESTGNGIGDYYHRLCMRAAQQQSQWTCHFLGWHEEPEYALQLHPDEEDALVQQIEALKARIDVDDKVQDALEEVHLLYNVGLSPAQLAWRRAKLADMDYDLSLFKQEYPLTLDECFQASGSSIFHKINFVPSTLWRDQGSNLYVLDPHPCKHSVYVVGADPSGGVGQDNACAQVIDITTMEQVAEYAYNKVEPDVFGRRVAELGKLFNGAYIVVEANNHGPVTIDAIRDTGYPEYLMYGMPQESNIYEDRSLMQLGFKTSARTKPIMIGKLRTLVANALTIHSELLRGEMTTFIEHPDGKLAAQENCHDDRVMALACATMGIERAGIYASALPRSAPRRQQADPFTLDGIIDEMRAREVNAMIRDQTSKYPEGF